jgi:hypothetical protein
MEADFSGYATKAGLKCSDGRVITPDAFKHMDGHRVPLVWQHGHKSPENVLGHAILEARDDGMYAYGFFNSSPSGLNAKTLVQHGDITRMSIYANRLVERAKQVLHGAITEVSLVLSGANPGALIDYVAVAHADGEIEHLEDEAVIYTGLLLEHESLNPEVAHVEKTESGSEKELTIQDVYDSMTQEQKDVLHYMVGAALEQAAEESDNVAQSADSEEQDQLTHSHMEGDTEMTRNVFEQDSTPSSGPVLSHSDLQAIVADAQRVGSLRTAFENYALQHGVENLDVLFPDAKMVGEIQLDSRRTEWVSGVMSGVRKSPFSRIKSVSADLKFDEARAKGYVKGTMKKEEFFSLSRRVTTPQTVYKKQKLDRDDVIDIVDLDVVAFMKGEMRLMLEEEIARAIFIGDGRDPGDEDKILETHIRPIAKDHPFFAVPVTVNLGDADSSYEELVDALVRARRLYKGSGTPTFYTSETVLSEIMLVKDGDGKRLYKTVAEAATAMRVANIVEVEAFESDPSLVGVVVNLTDYVIGADRGGQTSLFDDFDIDYNQYKYLIEARLCGALNKPHSALVVRNSGAADDEVKPNAPTWDSSTYTVTIPTQTGVVYQDSNGDELTGAQVLDAGEVLTVYAVAGDGYYVAPGSRTQWSYLRPTGS